VAYTYEATYNVERWNGVPNNWVECQGIRLESNIALSIIRDICQALILAGKPDGSIVFFEDGYIEPAYEFPSIHEIVTRANTPPVPVNTKLVVSTMRKPSSTSNLPVISDAIYHALIQVDTDLMNWRTLHGRIRSILLDRGYVGVETDVPEISSLGRLAMEAHQDQKIIYPDLATANQDELAEAAATIGLKSNGGLSRTLKFIETIVTERSLEDVEAMAWKVGVSLRTGRDKSEMMKKRRVLAAIANAGKLAQAI
jgi:hypothetical protein